MLVYANSWFWAGLSRYAANAVVPSTPCLPHEVYVLQLLNAKLLPHNRTELNNVLHFYSLDHVRHHIMLFTRRGRPSPPSWLTFSLLLKHSPSSRVSGCQKVQAGGKMPLVTIHEGATNSHSSDVQILAISANLKELTQWDTWSEGGKKNLLRTSPAWLTDELNFFVRSFQRTTVYTGGPTFTSLTNLQLNSTH